MKRFYRWLASLNEPPIMAWSTVPFAVGPAVPRGSRPRSATDMCIVLGPF